MRCKSNGDVAGRTPLPRQREFQRSSVKRPTDNQRNFPSVEIFNDRMIERFPRTENEASHETKISRSFEAVRSLLQAPLGARTGFSPSTRRWRELAACSRPVLGRSNRGAPRSPGFRPFPVAPLACFPRPVRSHAPHSPSHRQKHQLQEGDVLLLNL